MFYAVSAIFQPYNDGLIFNMIYVCFHLYSLVLYSVQPQEEKISKELTNVEQIVLSIFVCRISVFIALNESDAYQIQFYFPEIV